MDGRNVTRRENLPPSSAKNSHSAGNVVVPMTGWPADRRAEPHAKIERSRARARGGRLAVVSASRISWPVGVRPHDRVEPRRRRSASRTPEEEQEEEEEGEKTTTTRDETTNWRLATRSTIDSHRRLRATKCSGRGRTTSGATLAITRANVASLPPPFPSTHRVLDSAPVHQPPTTNHRAARFASRFLPAAIRVASARRVRADICQVGGSAAIRLRERRGR